RLAAVGREPPGARAEDLRVPQRGQRDRPDPRDLEPEQRGGHAHLRADPLAVPGPGRDRRPARQHRRDRPPVLRPGGDPRVQLHPGPDRVRHAHTPHERGRVRAPRPGRPEAGGGDRGGDRLPPGHAGRDDAPQAGGGHEQLTGDDRFGTIETGAGPATWPAPPLFSVGKSLLAPLPAPLGTGGAPAARVTPVSPPVRTAFPGRPAGARSCGPARIPPRCGRRRLSAPSPPQRPTRLLWGPRNGRPSYRYPAACNVKSSAYFPPRATSSAWLPCSMTVPPSSTRIRSAMRTVENRWLMSTAILPAVSSLNRWNTSYSARASSAAVGSSRISTSASRMYARASAIFCHSPPDRFAPPSKRRPSMWS